MVPRFVLQRSMGIPLHTILRPLNSDATYVHSCDAFAAALHLLSLLSFDGCRMTENDTAVVMHHLRTSPWSNSVTLQGPQRMSVALGVPCLLCRLVTQAGYWDLAQVCLPSYPHMWLQGWRW